jgi:hypothetical protein
VLRKGLRVEQDIALHVLVKGCEGQADVNDEMAWAHSAGTVKLVDAVYVVSVSSVAEWPQNRLGLEESSSAGLLPEFPQVVGYR